MARPGLRNIDGEQYDVIRDGRHVGTFVDTGDERFVCRPFIDRSKSGMKATRRTLDDAVLFILERCS